MTVRAVFTKAEDRSSFGPGEVIFSEREAGKHMYGVIEGTVELRKGHVVVATLGTGQVFGEMALVDESPRSLTAVATEPTTLAVIDRRTFLFLIHETPTFALDVMHSMASLLRAYNERLGSPD